MLKGFTSVSTFNMAINRSFIGTTPLNEATDVAIQMLSTRPDTNVVLDPVITPNILVGFYNGSTDRVELYIVNSAGNRYLRV